MIELTYTSNTGQVLTSIAELISEARGGSHLATSADPLHLFREALEFFQRCLSLQEYQLSQLEAESNASGQQSMEADERTVNPTNTDISNSDALLNEPPGEDTWATITEPVTSHALMDTLLAQAETMTSICGLLSGQRVDDPSPIEQYFQDSLREKIIVTLEKTGRQREVALARAKLRCALADANFSVAKFDIHTYEYELAGAYEEFADVGHDPQAFCDRADAEIVFNANMQRASMQLIENLSENSAKLNVIRWKHLTRALDYLTIASKLPNAKNLPRIHLRRGDCELLRRQLGAAPTSYDIALKSSSTLLKNAEIYYRGAAKLAKAEAAAEEDMEALIKEAVVAALMGDSGKLRERLNNDRIRVQEIVEDMREECLISDEDAKELSI
ncbi:MAG: hypothetical protein Q9166_001850 [cf. Caloplaca sp. 2 TL-2023]